MAAWSQHSSTKLLTHQFACVEEPVVALEEVLSFLGQNRISHFLADCSRALPHILICVDHSLPEEDDHCHTCTPFLSQADLLSTSTSDVALHKHPSTKQEALRHDFHEHKAARSKVKRGFCQD
jgi:hypothetical protein